MGSDKSHSGDEQRRSAAGDRGREGFGDDGGTRVGRPDTAQGAERDRDGFSRGPSSQPVKEGLEGAVLDEETTTGAGSEAVEGLHGAKGDRDPSDRTSVDTDAGGTRGGVDRRGSEPLENRETTHESNYGGKMGEPRKG